MSCFRQRLLEHRLGNERLFILFCACSYVYYCSFNEDAAPFVVIFGDAVAVMALGPLPNARFGYPCAFCVTNTPSASAPMRFFHLGRRRIYSICLLLSVALIAHIFIPRHSGWSGECSLCAYVRFFRQQLLRRHRKPKYRMWCRNPELPL